MLTIGWPELLIVLATSVIVVCAVLLHYEGLSLFGRVLKMRVLHHRAKIAVLIFAQLGLHVVEIWLFAVGYYLLTRAPDAGAILHNSPQPASQGLAFLDYVYFSAITFTTVGFGEVVPEGPIRFLCGMEALTGFVLITWSASFTFLEMQRYWGRD